MSNFEEVSKNSEFLLTVELDEFLGFVFKMVILDWETKFKIRPGRYIERKEHKRKDSFIREVNIIASLKPSTTYCFWEKQFGQM